MAARAGRTALPRHRKPTMNATPPAPLRQVQQRYDGRPTEDGGGVRLTRMFDPRSAAQTDPFLLFDEFRSDSASDYIAGFPPHPHRGFETVTYMLAGRMRHGDNHGNRGDLGPGSIQWMTAGRGIVHEEMPQQESGLMWGYQLWVNLPATAKMDPPAYQDIAAERIPTAAHDGVEVRVLAGRYHDLSGPVGERPTEPVYLDVSLAADRIWRYSPPAGHTVLVHGVEGVVRLGDDQAHPAASLGPRQLALMSRPDGDLLLRTGDVPGRALVIAGRPLREPVVHYGPFVMNRPEEIKQALDDYRSGRF
jgi:quercetin 2,3-dioxygenase